MSTLYKCLVIDDAPLSLNVVEAAARLIDVRCTKTPSANEAVEVLRTEVFDLLILDHDIDGVKGHEVLDFLKITPSMLPVLVYSGHVSDDDRKEYARRGVMSILQKPISKHAISFAMRRILKI
ncbi:MAG: response regulator [Candidatus Protistobacter heckmanni]|nr:response regulator [Candidatus Protistobacter heckmanni]